MVIVHEQRFVDPSPTARRLLWHVLAVGRSSREEPESYRGRDKAGMFLFWVVSGRGTLLADKSKWDIKTGPYCWLVDVARSRSFFPTSPRLVTAGLRFNGPNLDTWCKSLGGAGEFPFSTRSGIAKLQRVHAHVTQLVTHRPVNFEWQIHESITHLLGQLLAVRKVLHRQAEAVATPRPVARVLQAVLSDPIRAWRAAELAEIAGISYSGLRSLFREAQQESMSEFLRRVRLDRARLMLLDERLAIKEISGQLGFSSEFYFSQWFHRLTGISPSRFREDLSG